MFAPAVRLPIVTRVHFFPAMKTQPLLIAVLGVLVLALLLQEQRTAGAVERLRAEQQAALAQSEAVMRRPLTPPEEPQSAVPAAAQAQTDELAAAQARIDALEQDLDSVVDSLNTAIERLNHSALEAQRAQQPAWGVGQAVGEPDTMSAGDQRTAWAPAAADGGPEWLELGYEKAVEIAQVRVRETCGAGCIAKVAAILEGGREVVIWQGRQSAGEGIVDAPFNAPPGLSARGVKVYLDTARVPGWNEIDAVELIGRDGSRQWAKTASASSSYGAGALSGFGDGSTRLKLNDTFSYDALTR